MNGIFLLLGSNLGDRYENLKNAKKGILREIGNISSQSKVYETAPWGKEDQPAFLNQVIQVETKLSPDDLLEKVLKIEKKLGRERDDKWDARLIDIDILFYNNEMIRRDNLKIPHPEIKNRLFTLIPLSDLVGNEKFPGEDKTIHELIKLCTDNLGVEEYQKTKKEPAN